MVALYCWLNFLCTYLNDQLINHNGDARADGLDLMDPMIDPARDNTNQFN